MPISFLVTGDSAGTYTVDINGVTGTFVVRELPGANISLQWWMIIVGGVIVGLLAVAVIWLLIRSRSY